MSRHVCMPHAVQCRQKLGYTLANRGKCAGRRENRERGRQARRLHGGCVRREGAVKLVSKTMCEVRKMSVCLMPSYRCE